MKNKLMRRISTIVFSLIFIFSTIMGTLPAFAGTEPKTDLVTVNSDNSTAIAGSPNTENKLSGLKPVLFDYVKDSVKTNNLSNPQIVNLTDGDSTTDMRMSVGCTFAEINSDGTTVTYYRDGTKVYVDIAYDLGTATDISDILVLNHPSTTIRTGKYYVYAADTLAELYTDANKVANVDNSSLKNQRQVITVKSGKTLSAKYVGIRIIDPTITHEENSLTNPIQSTPLNNDYVRLYEIGVFAKASLTARGTFAFDNNAELLTYEASTGISNLIKGKTASYYSNKGSGDVAATQDLNLLPNLTDENLTTGFMGRDMRFYTETSGVVEYKKEQWSTALTYDLGSACQLDKLMLLNHVDSTLRTYHYAVYASSNEGSLFSGENFVAEYTNTAKALRQILSFNNVTARYVGIRVYDPISDYTSGSGKTPSNAYLRLNQIAVYGKAAPQFKFTATSSETETTDTTLGETNLISGKAPNSAKYYSDSGNAVTNTIATNNNMLTDGVSAKSSDGWRTSGALFAEYDEATAKSYYIGKGITEGEYYLDVTFNLAATKEITGFELFSHTTKDLRAYHYQVFLSETEADLYKTENMVQDFTNTDGSYKNTFKKVADNDVVFKAKFFGIRFLDPTYSKGVGSALAHNSSDNKNYVYPRINELTLYGKDSSGISGDVVMDNEQGMPDISDDNIALGMMPSTYFFDGSVRSSIVAGYSATLTDGDHLGEYRTSGAKFADYNGGSPKYIGSGIEDGSVYEDIVFDMAGTAKITALAVINHITKELRTKHYAVYFGNTTAANLFDSANMFKNIVNSEGSYRNILNVKELNGGTAVTAKYVGIRVYDPTFTKGTGVTKVTENTNNVYVRLNEIAIYGEVTSITGDKNIVFDNIAKLPDNFGNDIVLGMQPVIYGGIIDGATKVDENGQNVVCDQYSTISVVNNEALTDGNSTSEMRASGFKFAEINKSVVIDHTDNGDGKYYNDILFDMHSEVLIDGLAIIHHATEALRTASYQIYVSNDRTTVFDESSKLYDVKNGGYQRNMWNFNGMGKEVKGRYFAIRVLNPTATIGSTPATTVSKTDTEEINNIYSRLYEIAVYGEYTDPNFVYKEKFTPIKIDPPAETFTQFGKSLISGMPPAEAYVTGSSVSTYCKTITGGRATDGDPKTGYDFKEVNFRTQDSNSYLDLIWDLSPSGYFNFTNFAYLGLNNNLATYYTGWYKVYISDDYDLLFEDENVAFEYNSIKDDEPDTVCRGQLVEFDKPKYGCYMAIRILIPNTVAKDAYFPRIYEVGLYGTIAEIDATPTNLVNSMPVDAYTENSSGVIKPVSSTNLTSQEIANMYDGNKSTYAAIKTSGQNLDIIYNLCQDVDIYSIYLTSVSDKTKYINNYKIYTSNTLNGVWDSKSLVYSYNGKGNPVQRTGKVFNPHKNMRYVRIEILDKSDYSYISEIEIIGAKTNLFKNKNIAKNISDSSYSFYAQDIKTDDKDFVNLKNVIKVHNNAKTDAIGFTCGYEGKDTANILIDFGDFKTVNQIKIYFANRAWPYMPTKTKIYLGEAIDTINSNKSTPIMEYDGLPDDSIIDVSFAPRLCQYIRISFITGGDSNGVFEKMIYALSEIQAFGTSVVGMNKLSSNVMDFSDDDLGVKWGIVRNGPNDILTNIASSTVTVSNATNWQKTSLNKSPYLKIIGGKKYTFKFYDITGNEVKDFGGRQLEFSFKHRGGMTASTAMIGYSGNKWYVQPYDSDNEHLAGYVTCYEPKLTDNLSYSILNITTSTDPYWDKIGPLEDYGDEEPQYAPTAEVDSTTSAAAIVTEDGDFYIKPKGALRLPIDCQLRVEVTTYNIAADVYEAVSKLTDPEMTAATYNLTLVQNDIDYEFDGNVKMKVHIPDIIKGYFTGYKLIHVKNDGTAEYVDMTREGDYIYFNTTSLSSYALIGSGYHPNGDAKYEDTSFEDSGIDDSSSPATGDTTTVLFINLAILSLLMLVLVNSKKFKSKAK